MPDVEVVDWMEKLRRMMRCDIELARCLKMCRVGQRVVRATRKANRLPGQKERAAARRAVRLALSRQYRLSCDAINAAADLYKAGVRSWVLRCPDLTWEHWIALGPLFVTAPEKVANALFLFHIYHDNPFSSDALVWLSRLSHDEAELKLAS